MTRTGCVTPHEERANAKAKKITAPQQPNPPHRNRVIRLFMGSAFSGTPILLELHTMRLLRRTERINIVINDIATDKAMITAHQFTCLDSTHMVYSNR
jgi:hypothetical protein